MPEARVEPAGYESEEKTEPFSQTEFDARWQSIQVQRSSSSQSHAESAVHLDKLVVPQDKDIRILVRPLRSRSVSPGSRENCEWLALHAEVAAPDQPQHKVLAVTQTSKDIKFVVRIPGGGFDDDSPKPPLWCELYYDPASDNQILVNKSEVPIALSRVPQHLVASPTYEYIVNPYMSKGLTPGTWRIKVNDVEVLDFRILEKRPAVLRTPSKSSSDVSSSTVSDVINSSGKRSFVADENAELGPELRKIRSAETTGRGEDGVVMFLRKKADPLVFPLPTAAPGKEIMTTNGHALLDLEKDDSVQIPGGCELDSYELKKREPIASTTLSTVFTATSDHVNVPPDGTITVKVLKTRTPPVPTGAIMRPQQAEQNVIRQADTWLREYQSHEYLQHDSIVRLYGGDARHLSLYMEHVDAHDLSARGKWRGTTSDFFTGTRQDALRILRDIAGALHYIHGRDLVHNDIKPANILYSPTRGAVLCDFGLSTRADNPASLGGTPYYVPPEFIGRKLRGPPSDVWALGITMLYVLRKISFPDSRGRQHHPRPLYWMIADLNRGGAHHHHHHHHHNSRGAAPATAPSAVSQMQIWLSEINEAKDRLNMKDKMERLVAEMLIPNPAHRATMKRVVNELFAD
ncbi:uncharacterized protein E0L32_004026 [Thyridium curvatum]|uniref:Protein kinase domain-containing protein n=1 Tax=Thyridium curvatum TaxID=1093900 RepID=A0A507B950_9PEZI|nr:uncharacterized protein E0L32_004026 [Thyridium curvatum]TPX16377.1 hypothetical protein E0L32_004026 [Thyridium curvatum]